MGSNAIKIFLWFLLSGCWLSGCESDRPATPGPDMEEPATEGSFSLPVVHHISRDDAGNNAVADAEVVANAMAFLNANFQEWDITFTTKEIRFLDNTEWNQRFFKSDDFGTRRSLLSSEDPESINIFYFDVLLNRPAAVPDTLGATALFPAQGNNLKLSASAFDPENTATLTHEIGHYLGLFHTDDDNEDNRGRLELADGSNCADAGDFICDTPASPDLNDSNIDEANGRCTYIGTETDANGDRYAPDVFNFMTQWAGSEADGRLCRRQFSPGQVARMKEVLRTSRAYLTE